jgi:serine/threonine protein kinase
MSAVKTPNAEPIPGYRLLEPLGRGGYGEVWKCTAPGGLTKAIKFVAPGDSISDESCAATQELQALQHIKEIRHPFLLSIERVELIDGELMVVMELAERSLGDLFEEYRRDGRIGIPRNELIHYFRDAAEALDLLNLEHGLQHLDVKPRNLFLVGRHIKVADFGLINSLAELHGGDGPPSQLFAATPVYSSPESFLGRITLFSDQYSLAVAYTELLTGSPPFSGKNFRQLAIQHTGMEPDLSHLPEHDRPVVARALKKEPGTRYRSCLDFIRALEEAAPVPPPARTPSRLVRALKSSTQTDLQTVRGTLVPVFGDGTSATPVVEEGSAPAKPGETLANYQFLECLARLPIGEIWKASHEDGRRCLIKLVFGCQAADEASGSGAVARLAALRHPALEPFVLLRDGPNRIALIYDEHDGTLADRLNECRTASLHGIPRGELLKYFRRAAETLDELLKTHRLQHLNLSPRSLILDRGLLRFADFGIAELIWLPAGLQAAKFNVRYAAPESFDGNIAATSDQYSLALIYQELLTGLHAFRHLSPRQLSSVKTRGAPDVSLLPASDRAIVSRALHANPEQRFASCTEFVSALAQAGERAGKPARASAVVVTVKAPTVIPASAPVSPALSGSESRDQIKRLLGEVKGNTDVRLMKGFRFRVVPNELMEHDFSAHFLQGTLPIRLEGFRQHWLGKVIDSGDNKVVYHIAPPVRGLQRFWKQEAPTLKLQIAYSKADAAQKTGIAVTLQPLPRGEHLLEELGPRILDSVRQYLQAEPDRRREERFRLAKSLRVIPVFGSKDVGEGIVAQPLDISQTGLGFYLPCRPASSEVLLEVGCDTSSGLVLAATIVRAERRPDGRYLIGVAFSGDKSDK